MITPKLSVVMPVHNARPFLAQSIQSILSQTFEDFEFVILDDGSTDGSSEIASEWAQKDSRIKLHIGKDRLGLSGSSNFAVSKCTAQVIARMDADDISQKDRLRQQWEVVQKDPTVVAVGTLFVGIDAEGRQVRPRDRWRIVRRSRHIPFPHGSSMFRRNSFDEVGGYCEQMKRGEDQDLFFRLTKKGRVVTLPDVLYQYRYHMENSTVHENSLALTRDLNGQTAEALYMLGAMRLWAGHKSMIPSDTLTKQSLKFNPQTLLTLASVSWGSMHPGSLRSCLRLLIRARDMIAGFQIKDGRPYEWRLK